MKWLLIVAVLALVVGFLWANAAWGKVIEGGPDRLVNTRSLGDLIARDDSLHIIFVHGMRSEGPGNSKAFREALLSRYPDSSQSERVRTYVELGAMPIAKVGTWQIWRNETEWEASRPFLDRYTLTLGNGKRVVVDEINWWPLLFPIKCRMLLVPERNLSGADKDHLRLCAKTEEPFHPWITKKELDDLLANRPRSGGGAWANRWGKREILNWGLSDAVVALGPMKVFLTRAMNKAFAIAESEAKAIAAEDRIVVSESLGSFVVLDAYRSAGGVKDYLDRTDHLYFFANQFALLELGRIQLTRPAIGGPELVPAFTEDAADAPATPLEGLQQWARRSGPSFVPESMDGPDATDAESAPRQIIAFNDPSDLLTYDVPCMEQVAVVNLYVRNGVNWFGLFVDPLRAHTGHAGNRRVWKTMLRRNTSAPEPPSSLRCPR